MLDGLASTGSDTTLTKAGASGQKLANDLDQFMTLLTTQLKYQDPLDPMDPNEFTSQLVEFAGVEQQINGNKNLEEMISLQQTSLLGTVVGYIGTQVEVSGNKMPLENGQARADYVLDEQTDSTTISVAGEDGEVVFFTEGETEVGAHSFEWDGADNFGFPMDDGVYTVTIVALNEEQKTVGVSQTITGKVTAVTVEDGKAYLSISDAEYTMEDIIAVREDNAE